jgi:hemerythrin-like domain-containing protein
VLHLLETLLAEVSAGEHIDLDVLSEIVNYVQTYPDLVHHKREDVIFSIYLEHSTCQYALVDRLMNEHKLLVKKTRDLREHVEQWRHDSPVARERVVAMIADYLHMQWDHLNLEESEVFNLLQQELTPRDWERVEASLPSTADPLFGNPMQQRFEHIFDRLIA